MIEPFGVGLCPAYLVLDGCFIVHKDTEMVHGEVKRGMKIICFLKEDQSKPLSVQHFSVGGQLEFHALLFLSRRAPFRRV